MVLSDVIEGIGCIERDSVQNIGTDVLFLSNEGVRGLGRTIQEKSSPIGNISKNVRTDLMNAVKNHRGNLKSVYSPQDAFYLLSFPEDNILYCFDLRSLLPDGSAKVTTWVTITPDSFVVLSDDSLYFGLSRIGGDAGIYQYAGYFDVTQLQGSSYSYCIFKYESTAMDFGISSNLKFLKKFESTIVGNAGEQSALIWYWDYDTNTVKNVAYLPDATEVNAAEYDISECGDSSTTRTVPFAIDNKAINGASTTPYLGEFTSAPSASVVNSMYYNLTSNKLFYSNGSAWIEATGLDTDFVASEYTTGVYIQTPSVNASGSGKVLQVGISAIIQGKPYAVQSIDISVLLGRTK
jgi:hypothetical protein